MLVFIGTGIVAMIDTDVGKGGIGARIEASINNDKITKPCARNDMLADKLRVLSKKITVIAESIASQGFYLQ